MSGLSLADGFDAVTIGIENKRRIIIIAVFGMYSRPAVVLSAMRQSRPVKRSHGLAGRRGESDVKALTGHSDIIPPKFDSEFVTIIITVRQPVSDSRLKCPDTDVTQRSKDRIVKSAGAPKVSNSK